MGAKPSTPIRKHDGVTSGILSEPSVYGNIAEEDVAFVRKALCNVLVFGKLEDAVQDTIVRTMVEVNVSCGVPLITQGSSAEHSETDMYIVKEGTFDVLVKRNGVMFKAATRKRGDCFGETSLMYNSPRSASVYATSDAKVWVLSRENFRCSIQHAAEAGIDQVYMFLNSVPLLDKLSNNHKLSMANEITEETHEQGCVIIKEGDVGSRFYIIKDGEAAVISNGKEINRLFRSDFFGERALLKDEPRIATIITTKQTTLLSIDHNTFIRILGPLQDHVEREQSTIAGRVCRLVPSGSNAGKRERTHVALRRADGTQRNLMGYQDDIREICGHGDCCLHEVGILGKGAFSTVFKVNEMTSGRVFALKRVAKESVVSCSTQIFDEQNISRNLAHTFCVRQHASFLDDRYLYMLLDYMGCGDLLDLCVDRHHTVSGGCCIFSEPRGMIEETARFYVGCIVLAIEHLHNESMAHRDIKLENVMIDSGGYARLGDFGFSKSIPEGTRTFTLCGTPGYIAPEVVLGKGYSVQCDWFSLGVLVYMLLTVTYPFNNADTMSVLHDREPPYPKYLSPEAKDLIQGLLERKPHARLAGTAIKMHAWFSSFNWIALAKRDVCAPHVYERRTSESSVSVIARLSQEYNETFKNF